MSVQSALSKVEDGLREYAAAVHMRPDHLQAVLGLVRTYAGGRGELGAEALSSWRGPAFGDSGAGMSPGRRQLLLGYTAAGREVLRQEGQRAAR